MRTHIDDVASALIYDDLREVILAGTSSSGAVISGVADRAPERISQLVYVDAVADEADLRWMLARLRQTPFGHFTSPVRLANPAAERLPRTCIGCLGFPHPGFDRYAQAASQNPLWRLFQLESSHLPYITSPHELAPILLEVAAA